MRKWFTGIETVLGQDPGRTESPSLLPANKPTIAVIIVAAGRGSRAGSEHGPKQYRMIGGKSVLNRSMSAFTAHPHVDHIITVIHADDGAIYEASAPGSGKILPPVHGGKTRQASVFAGLQALSEINPDRVLIHDAARPFVDAGTMGRVIAAIGENCGALPAIAVADTLKRVEQGIVTDTIDRAQLYGAQTPQGFPYSGILAAHEKAANAGRTDFTDDTALAQWEGMKIQVVEGASANQKLTTNEDILRADQTMNSQIPDIRTGHGYDVHALEPGSSVRLCGIDIAHTASLKGHSDADVGLHALTDALLGTIGDGDIGSHFPPSDPQWNGASSDRFLRHAVNLVHAAGGTITHLDTTIICEAPMIGPHREKMRAEIARICDLDVSRISVKATTNERIGFIGREEGIAALATATVVMSGQI